MFVHTMALLWAGKKNSGYKLVNFNLYEGIIIIISFTPQHAIIDIILITILFIEVMMKLQTLFYFYFVNNFDFVGVNVFFKRVWRFKLTDSFEHTIGAILCSCGWFDIDFKCCAGIHVTDEKPFCDDPSCARSIWIKLNANWFKLTQQLQFQSKFKF